MFDATGIEDTATWDSDAFEDAAVVPPEDLVEPPDVEAPVPDVPVPGPDVPSPEPCAWPDCPFEVAAFPFHHEFDTTGSPVTAFAAYGCAPEIDESGPEVVYAVTVPAPGTLLATVTDGAGIDVDVHLLASLDPADCLARADVGLSVSVVPGTYVLVVDTWGSTDGPLAGAYSLDVRFVPQTSLCAMKDEWLARIGTDELLHMPATGKVVMEAHLVTVEEAEAGVFPSGWPTSFTDHIEGHWSLSEATTGFALPRSEPWAPCCEPSNEYGQGSTKKPPMEAETWYVNMRWKKAPAAGTRYLVFDGRTGLAVVAAAGYENGPGDVSRIGGAAEEVHLWLGTEHLSTLTFTELLDQTLAYGPIVCD